MKFLFVLSLFVVILALSHVKAQADEAKATAKTADRKTIAFGKIEATDGKQKVYDPCNSNSGDNFGCSWACSSNGYYYGGFCSGYDCYCYV